MSDITLRQYRDASVAFYAPDTNTVAIALVDAVLGQSFRYNVSQPLDADVNTTSTHTLDQATSCEWRIKTFKMIVGTTVTSANTSVANVALVYNNGAGGADTTIASANTATTLGGGTGDITAGIAYNFTLNTSNVVVPSGSQIQIKVTKAGASGKALPFTSFEVKGAPS